MECINSSWAQAVDFNIQADTQLKYATTFKPLNWFQICSTKYFLHVWLLHVCTISLILHKKNCMLLNACWFFSNWSKLKVLLYMNIALNVNSGPGEKSLAVPGSLPCINRGLDQMLDQLSCIPTLPFGHKRCHQNFTTYASTVCTV